MYTSSHALTSAFIFRELLAEGVTFLPFCCCEKSLLSLSQTLNLLLPGNKLLIYLIVLLGWLCASHSLE